MRPVRVHANRSHSSLTGVTTLLLVAGLPAVASDSAIKNPPPRVPSVQQIFPYSASVGQRTEVLLYGNFLDQSETVTLDSEKLSGRVLEATSTRTKIEIQSAPEAAPGLYGVRLGGKRGLSNRFHFRLTGWKSLTETEPNDLSEQAQSVTAPLSVNGMIEDTDDADFFRFHAETGETIAFQVLLGRNGYATGGEIGNVTLTLMDTAGHVLGASFSHFIWDPYLQHDFEKKGDYLLAVEHKRLAVTCFVTECENKRLDETYQLLIGRSPVLWSVWPPAGRRGTTVEAQLTADFVNVKTPLEFSGRGLRARTLSADGVSPTRLQLAIEIDPDAEPGKHFLRVPDESGSLSPLVFLVYDEELSREQEPNNSLESSPVLSVPSLFLGRIDEPGDIDSFAFQANERDRLVFQLDARKVGSSMFDPHVAVLAADGDIVGINDDQPSFYNPRNRDAKLELQIPGAPNCAQRSDRFFLQVRDTSKHSGEGLFYLLRARKQTPTLNWRRHRIVFSSNVAEKRLCPCAYGA